MTIEVIIPMIKDALGFFLYTVTELAILFIGISIIVGVLQEFIPPEKIKVLLCASKGRGYFIGAGLGALTPFCSCSTIPIMVGLLKAQAGFGPTLAFLFTSPLVNPVIVGLFFITFGFKPTIIYSILALLMAIVISYILEKFNYQRFIKKDVLEDQQQHCCSKPTMDTNLKASGYPRGEKTQTNNCCDQASPSLETSPKSRWRRIFKDAVNEFKTFLPYILFGVALGAIAYGFVPKELIIKYAGPDNLFAIPIAAVIGVPLYVRVETMIPITVALMGKGMSMGAVVALVIGGAGASIPEVIMLKRIFKGPMLGVFLGAIFLIAVTSGFLFNAAF
ncbi:hypothetical protein SAMN05660420_03088 [Desulfuromusa kysingii]|uniref:Permease n=1 Tax=Desulfuromusa kysingii TaxID=37625 RepID=A0A1H4DTR2_9BACT|nr:permease [Desulfuromusa kysingii]SEA75582.1 hypothetical protein SAMN05660420_03088 [Desulfuromusa kysingii]